MRSVGRFTFETRPSDFVARRAGGLYSVGCCCCCCCLHWIGAAAGGVVGVAKGVGSAEKAGRVHPVMRLAVQVGAATGVLCALVAAVVTSMWGNAEVLWALAVVPSLILVPVFGGMLFFVWLKGRRLRRAFGRSLALLPVPIEGLPPPNQGVFRTSVFRTPARTGPPKPVFAPELMSYALRCPGCGAHLGEGEVVAECQECGTRLDAHVVPKFPAVDGGMRLALHVGGKALFWSSVLMIASYAIMWLLFQFLG